MIANFTSIAAVTGYIVTETSSWIRICTYIDRKMFAWWGLPTWAAAAFMRVTE